MSVLISVKTLVGPATFASKHYQLAEYLHASACAEIPWMFIRGAVAELLVAIQNFYDRSAFSLLTQAAGIRQDPTSEGSDQISVCGTMTGGNDDIFRKPAVASVHAGAILNSGGILFP